MSSVREGVRASNAIYVLSFGDKVQRALPPACRFAILACVVSEHRVEETVLARDTSPMQSRDPGVSRRLSCSFDPIRDSNRRTRHETIS